MRDFLVLVCFHRIVWYSCQLFHKLPTERMVAVHRRHHCSNGVQLRIIFVRRFRLPVVVVLHVFGVQVVAQRSRQRLGTRHHSETAVLLDDAGSRPHGLQAVRRRGVPW